ncbi:hypothetical protein HMPREF3207_01595 [Citrobacter koseri]|nr:hypothetical protein HMPREF3207_01595 [Citrobacter koseri]
MALQSNSINCSCYRGENTQRPVRPVSASATGRNELKYSVII